MTFLLEDLLFISITDYMPLSGLLWETRILVYVNPRLTMWYTSQLQLLKIQNIHALIAV